MRLNQQQTHLTLDISRSLADSMHLDTSDPNKEFRIDLGDSWWRLDKKTFAHPNPDIQLQWNVGLWFLILGLLVPKLFDAVTNWLLKG